MFAIFWISQKDGEIFPPQSGAVVMELSRIVRDFLPRSTCAGGRRHSPVSPDGLRGAKLINLLISNA